MKNRTFVSKLEVGDRVTLGWNTSARFLAALLLMLTMVVMVLLIICKSDLSPYARWSGQRQEQ